MFVFVSRHTLEIVREALLAALEDKGILPGDPPPGPGLDVDARPLLEALRLIEAAGRAEACS
jgi:hypothetical protein